MSAYYFDAHSHSDSLAPEIITLRSFSHNHSWVQKEGFFSLGIHPWFTKDSSLQALSAELTKVMESDFFLALGECGLDRVANTSWTEQLKYFSGQIDLAKKLKIQVVVIHSVKAYDEILNLIEEYQYSGTLIFHDFNASEEIAQKILSKGHILSLGKTLERENSRVRKYLDKEMLSQLLLESDDEKILITKRYEQLTSLLAIPQEELKEALWKNALRIFGRKLETKF